MSTIHSGQAPAAGCDVGQGFLLGRPADAAATTRVLTSAQPR